MVPVNVPEGFPRFKEPKTCDRKDRSSDGLRRTPLRAKAKASKKLRDGRLREGTKEFKAERAKVVERSQGWCEASGKASPDCQRRAVDPHHVIMRSRGGSDYADNLLAVCRACHDWIDDNPLEATAAGLLKHGWDKDTDRDE